MIRNFIKENPGTSLIGGIIIVILIQSYQPITFLTNILWIIDSYLRLIFTSWPAVILILGLVFLSEEERRIYQIIKKKVKVLFPSRITETKDAPEQVI